MNANPTNDVPTSTMQTSGSPTLTGSQARRGAQQPSAAGHPLADSQPERDPHGGAAVPLAGDQNRCDPHMRRVSGDLPRDTDHTTSEIHTDRVGVAPPPNQPPTISAADPMQVPSSGWLELRIWAEMHEDAQKSRIANTNRAERGGVDPAIYTAFIESLDTAEHVAALALRRTFRRVVPTEIVAWQKATLGIGEHLLARLLGHLGDPLNATPHHWEGTGPTRVLVADEPHLRTVSQLWQYCGHGAPGRRTRGMTTDEAFALGNPTLKMIVHLCAEACMKTRTSPFRAVYDDTREAVDAKPHTAECVRCGPSGKPAQIGSPWSPGHQHAHALRIVGKEILRDLWTVAGGSQVVAEPNKLSAASGERKVA